ncbi:MAG: hypothetical protein NPINA01_10460 [Nitrospinaceae bacterium]|nr:MAG: hypothetical protein NPINA01_10460 [Nitrospinaceae bacterium]
MKTAESSPVSLNNLRDGPETSLEEGLERARRLISDRSGIITDVQFTELTPEEPAVYWAQTRPADVSASCGQPALNLGSAASVDPNRAVMKAVGESVERYCSAQYNRDEFQLSAFEKLDAEAVPPQSFALFSETQHADPEFPFSPMNELTPLRWVEGFSLTHDKPVFVPATFVYVPYEMEPHGESKVHFPISTGLACAPNLVSAIYKGILEVVERDAFMITWQNRISPVRLNLWSSDDPFVNRLLNLIKRVPVQCSAFVLTLDINIPFVMVVLQSTTDRPPYTIIGIGIDLDPTRAIVLALEEAYFSYVGMNRYIKKQSDFKPEPGYRNVKTPIEHGFAHAVWPELRKSSEFLFKSDKELSVEDLPNKFNQSMVTNVKYLVKLLQEKGLNAVIVDLTTPDINEVGFKVIRAVVPGLQPLDVSHEYRYLGGRRLYAVPYESGLHQKPLTERELNSDPHLFP